MAQVVSMPTVTYISVCMWKCLCGMCLSSVCVASMKQQRWESQSTHMELVEAEQKNE